MPDPQLTRRRALALLGGAAGGLAAALTGCTALPSTPRSERPGCVVRGELSRRTALAGLPLVYEVNGNRSPFWFDADFATRLETWLGDLRSIGVRAGRLWTYGAWTDGAADTERGCRSWHDSGRAFDLARIELTDGGFLSCRHDQWSRRSGAALRRSQLEYWALAASIHRRFAYVVTYPYDTAHHNHIHIDNGRSGGTDSTFDPGSPTQVQAVQAIAAHVWGRPVQLSGRWDADTRRAVGEVLAELDGPASLTAEGGWDRYLASSAARIAD